MIKKATLATVLILSAWILSIVPTRAEGMLQYFNTSWAEITRKMPELAEAGYDSIWLPPPTKGSGALSVGYDVWDRFDLGSKDQRGSVRTRYGTEAELIELVSTAHRFGIRIYLDNVVNHCAFDTPGYDANSPISLYPGMLPGDFHLRVTGDGFYRKWDNTRDWNDAWQVQYLGLSDLIDIASEPGPTNGNHGYHEGDTLAKPEFVRHPNNPEYYCYKPSGAGQRHAAGQGIYVGFGPGNGISTALLAANPDFYKERVEDFLCRSARWEIDRTKADGFRLDAVKHVPADFFGATYGADRDSSAYGYTGQVQLQFNLSRGFSDWDNHRDTVFDTEKPRDDAMLFGEHLGQPPPYDGYLNAGMRLVDNDLHNNLNGMLGNPWGSLAGFDGPGYGGFPPGSGVMFAQSHDNDYSVCRELQHAICFTRAGLPLIYTDGNHHADVLNGSGGAFPRHANTAYLGQWGDARIPNLLKIHQSMSRGWQFPRWSDADFLAYERIDEREFAESDQTLKQRKGVTMIMMLNDNYGAGQERPLATSFPSAAGGGSENNPDTNDEYLYQYARGYGSQTGFYSYASALGSVLVDKGSYFVFSPRTPEESSLWSAGGGSPLTIYQNNAAVGKVSLTRRDGADGDPGFNPYGLPDSVTSDYSYTMDVPRVTDSSALRLVVRADGSAENILLKLDGGIDLNGTRPAGNSDPFYRDNPPALSTDVFLGYEQPGFTRRQYAEKFAAKDTTRNHVGSSGAETYATVIGSKVFAIANGPLNSNDYSTDGGTLAAFLYHDPLDVVGGTPVGGWPGGVAPKQYGEFSSSLAIWAKPNGVGLGFRMFCYYTGDGSNPEGAGGEGIGTTKVAEMNWSHNQGSDDWWMTATLPKPAAGGTVKYKIGIFKAGAPSIYPSGPASVAKKSSMMTVFEIDGFQPATVAHAQHNDYSATTGGLEEGFHVLRGRVFLKRDGKASLYNTFTQTFYYDAQPPRGQILYPANNGDTVGGNGYGAVVRSDFSATAVWYRIVDADDSNDDAATGAANGNAAWVMASEETSSPGITPSDPALGRQWRFDYINIPASGTATLQVRIKEISSSADNSLSDSAGHFTTLTRSVNTAGPDLRLFVGWPQADRALIDPGYVFKTYFTKALAAGMSEADVKSHLVVRYGSNESWPWGAVTLDSSGYSINWDETSQYHALVFQLPDLYNGVPDYLFRVEATFTRAAPLASLIARRLVTAAAPAQPRVAVTQPLEVDSDGQAVRIVLPDFPALNPLAYAVRVETDLSATDVSISFNLGTGTLTPVDHDSAVAGVQPLVQGTSKLWEFIWILSAPGDYRFTASATGPRGTSSASRNAHVVASQAGVVAPVDMDGDGLPGAWETANGLSDTDATGVNGRYGDPDGDGIPNIAEYLFGTNPQVANPAPKVTLTRQPGSWHITFPTVPDRRYQLQVSQDLRTWLDLGAALDTTGATGPGVFQADDAASSAARLYRMVVSAAN